MAVGYGAGFSLARHLHEAGYAAEIDLGGQEPANLRWRIDVQGRAPLFVLTDRVKRKKFEAQTADEVLKLLGEGGELDALRVTGKKPASDEQARGGG